MNILITGGASGLGEAIVKKLASGEGSKIWFTWSRSAEKAAALSNSLKNTEGIHCDFKDAASIDALVDRIGTIAPDVLINNAWLPFEKKHFHKLEPARFVDSFQLNIVPLLRITAESIRGFRERKFGKIINIATTALLNKPPIGWSDYVACKAYLVAMSKSWATENARFNITSNCISPAFMQTDFTSDTDERIVEEMQKSHPLKTLLQPAEVADAVDWFVRCSQQVNGTNFIINSGTELI